MSSRNSTVTAILLSVGALALVALLVLSIYYIRVENKKTAELLHAIDTSEAQGLLLQSVRALKSSAGREIEAFEKLVLSADNIVPVIETLEQSGRGLGLDTAITSVTEEKLGEMAVMRLSIQSEGEWVEHFSFLRAVESLPYRVIFEEVSFIRSGTTWESRFSILLPLFK